MNRKNRHRGTRAESLESRLLLSAYLVKDINTDTVGSFPYALTPAGSSVYFTTHDLKGIWTSDGTGAGTRQVLSEDQTVAGFIDDIEPAAPGKVFFSANGLWYADIGTGTITHLSTG